MSMMEQASPARPLRSDRRIASPHGDGAPESAGAAARFELMPAPVFAEPAAFMPRDFQAALSLLECASKALEILYDRRDQLEASLEDVSVRAEDRVAAAQAKVLDWQRHAAGAKSEVQDLERRLSAMQQRAELAEMQLEAERVRAEAAERQADDSLALLEAFHAKVLLAFGRDSRAHRALIVTTDELGKPL